MAVVGVAIGEEIGTECILHLMIVIMGEVCVTGIFVAALTVVHIHIHTDFLCRKPPVRHLVRSPVVGVGSGEVVDIIHVAEQRHTGVVCGAHGEQSGHVQVVVGAAGVYIAHPSYVVLLLKVDVHHQLLVVHVAVEKLAQTPGLVVNLHRVYRVSGKILKHDCVVALEEVLAVEKKTLHKAAVHIYAAVGFQLHTGQLFHQGVEHGAFSQLESVGIIDKRVALVVELHLRGCNHNLVYGMNLRTFHIYGGEHSVCLAPSDLAYLYRSICCLISFLLCLDDIVSFLDFETVQFSQRSVSVVVSATVKHHAVRRQKRHLRILYCCAQNVIFYRSINVYASLFLSEG